MRLEGVDAAEEEKDMETQQGLTPDGLAAALSKNEIRRQKKEQRKREVGYGVRSCEPDPLTALILL